MYHNVRNVDVPFSLFCGLDMCGIELLGLRMFGVELFGLTCQIDQMVESFIAIHVSDSTYPLNGFIHLSVALD